VTVAAEARDAVRTHPFLLDALRTGVVNYTAAAEFIDLDADTETVATALRRFEDDLDGRARPRGAGRVTMEREGVDGVAVDPDDGETAIVLRGDVSGLLLGSVLRRLDAVGVSARAAGVDGDALAVVVGRRDGATALRVIEDAASG
jgi:hypothetical protein